VCFVVMQRNSRKFYMMTNSLIKSVFYYSKIVLVKVTVENDTVCD